MLVLTSVRRAFNKGTIGEKRVLNGIDFSLRDGDLVTVIGDSGVGESTMLNMVAGVCPIDLGKIGIDGISIPRQSEHRRAKHIGHVFQDPMKSTAAGMGIRENMALASRGGQRHSLGWGVRANEKDYYGDVLTHPGPGLQTRMTSKMRLLSGGQRQALTFLIVTLQKLRLLLLDEHAATLDPQTAKKVLDLTNEMVTEQKLAALMATHNMKGVIQIDNRLVMMNDGRIVYDIPSEVKKDLAVDDLLKKFSEANEGEFTSDRVMLSKQFPTKLKRYFTLSHATL